MKITFYFLSILTLLFYNSCKQDKPVITPPKTYPDLSGLWGMSFPILNYIDTNNGKVTFSFLPFPEKSTSFGFFIDKLNDSNTLYEISCPYVRDKGVDGRYFKKRNARVNTENDSITFSIYEDLNGDSVGYFTGKYNNNSKQLNGIFYTFYQMYCSCPYSGKKLPYNHNVSLNK